MNTMHANKSIPPGDTEKTQRPGVSYAPATPPDPQREEEALRKDLEFFGRIMRDSSKMLPSPNPRTLREIRAQAFRQAGRKAHRAHWLRRNLWPAIAAALLMAGVSLHFAGWGLSGESSSCLATTHRILILVGDEEPQMENLTETLADVGERASLESLAERLLELQDMQPETDELNLLQQVVPEPLPTTLRWHNTGAAPARIYG